MSELAEKNRERGPGRALCIGVLMAVVINTVFPYGLLVMGTLDWTGDFIALSAIFLLFVLVIINIPLKWIKREWGLSVYELVLIYAMMAVASAIPSTGVTAQLVPFLAGIFYMQNTKEMQRISARNGFSARRFFCGWKPF